MVYEETSKNFKLHPNLVEIKHIKRSPNSMFITMELCEDGDLEYFISK